MSDAHRGVVAFTWCASLARLLALVLFHSLGDTKHKSTHVASLCFSCSHLQMAAPPPHAVDESSAPTRSPSLTRSHTHHTSHITRQQHARSLTRAAAANEHTALRWFSDLLPLLLLLALTRWVRTSALVLRTHAALESPPPHHITRSHMLTHSFARGWCCSCQQMPAVPGTGASSRDRRVRTRSLNCPRLCLLFRTERQLVRLSPLLLLLSCDDDQASRTTTCACAIRLHRRSMDRSVSQSVSQVYGGVDPPDNRSVRWLVVYKSEQEQAQAQSAPSHSPALPSISTLSLSSRHTHTCECVVLATEQLGDALTPSCPTDSSTAACRRACA